MTRKSISDMLRAELKKSSEDEQDANGISVAPADISAEATETPPNAVVTEKDKMKTPAKPSTRRRTTKPANTESAANTDLEVTVTKLREDLKEAQQKETSLQQQINALQTDLQEQQTSIQQMLGDIEQKNQIKSRLEEAKQDALQLAEANSKLKQEVNALKKENEELKAQLAKEQPKQIVKLGQEKQQKQIVKLGQSQTRKSADSPNFAPTADTFQSWCYD